jgi:6-phosphogluconolactonase (cycloisomerase 2 family)
MRLVTRLAAVTAAAALTVAVAGVSLAGASVAAWGRHPSEGAAVFVATDDPAGNHVVAYRRNNDGSLHLAASYSTGGQGGVLGGSVVDHTASQGALAIDRTDDLLYAVNAGSNSVSVFSVHGDQLHLRQVVASGGSFPVSIAVHDRLVEVLNARSGGSVRGFVQLAGYLFPIPGATTTLGLPTLTPEFTHTPGQVAFTPDGSKVLVTTKAATSAVDVYSLRWNGTLSATPTVTTFAGDVPFALTFDQTGHAQLVLAGSNSVATANISPDGRLHVIQTNSTGQAATCWITSTGRNSYVSNAGSGTVTGYVDDGHGHLTNLGNTATHAGTVDSAGTPDGRFLYVQGGAGGTVDEFHITAGGTLTLVGSQTVPNAIGGEGIVTS